MILMIIVITILAIIAIIEFVCILWLKKNYLNEKKIKEVVDFFRGLWSKFIIYVIATSVIGLFVASFVLNKEISLSTMNEWVSLVLGLVALFVGIISLILSFYNLDQAIEAQNEHSKVMQHVQESIVEKLNEIKKTVDDTKEQVINTAQKEEMSKQNKYDTSYRQMKNRTVVEK